MLFAVSHLYLFPLPPHVIIPPFPLYPCAFISKRFFITVHLPLPLTLFDGKWLVANRSDWAYVPLFQVQDSDCPPRCCPPHREQSLRHHSIRHFAQIGVARGLAPRNAPSSLRSIRASCSFTASASRTCASSACYFCSRAAATCYDDRQGVGWRPKYKPG